MSHSRLIGQARAMEGIVSVPDKGSSKAIERVGRVPEVGTMAGGQRGGMDEVHTGNGYRRVMRGVLGNYVLLLTV